MNIHHHPELLDRLAASYALGTLRGGARRRFESMARAQPAVRAAAITWQTQLGSMAELQAKVEPPPAVWTRIDNLVRAEREQMAMAANRNPAPTLPAAAAQPSGWLRSLALWRFATVAGVCATVLVLVLGSDQRAQLVNEIAAVRQQLQAVPDQEYVAVLSDDKSSASMLVTFNPKSRTLVLQRVGNYQESADKSLQLWALPPAGGPRSLGVLGHDKLLRLAAAEGDVREVPTLAISLEPSGGVPGAGGPTGPVLFKGALIQRVQ